MTDTGRVREHNEDAFVHDPAIGLYVLADGMGGGGRDFSAIITLLAGKPKL